MCTKEGPALCSFNHFNISDSRLSDKIYSCNLYLYCIAEEMMKSYDAAYNWCISYFRDSFILKMLLMHLGDKRVGFRICNIQKYEMGNRYYIV